MALVVTIEGVEKQVQPGWSINSTINGRDTLACEILSLDGSYRPSIDNEIIFVESLGSSSTSNTIGTGSKTFTTQSNIPIANGQRIRIYRYSAVTTWMEGVITSYSGDQLTVNMLVYNGSGTYTDWIIGWRIFGGEIQAPSERGFGNQGLSAIVTRVSAIDFNCYIDRRYINETISAGTLKAALQVIVTYLSTYGVSLDPAQVDGPSLPELVYNYQKCSNVLNELSTLSGYVFEIDYYKILRMYPASSLSAPYNISSGDGRAIGDVIVSSSRAAPGMVYANRIIVIAGTPEVPIIGQADDLTEQGLHDLWEYTISAPTIFEQTLADDLAAAYLVQHTLRPKTAEYLTYLSGLKSGQVQTINLATRGVNNSFLITELIITVFGNLIKRRIIAVEGNLFLGNWRSLYQAWSGSISQVSIVPATAGYGRSVFFLGGSAVEYVQSPDPTWIPASAIQVSIDTVKRGSSSGVVTVRLRATSGSVTARLRNISDGITAGTSAVITNTSWETVTFSVALTNGSKIYELQLLPSVANTDVAAVGYLE